MYPIFSHVVIKPLAHLVLVMGILVLSLFGGCAKEEESRTPTFLIVLELTAPDCGECHRIHEILQELKPVYEDQLVFITLNISDKLYKLQAKDTAREFHARGFVSKYQDRPGIVAIIDGRNGKPWKILEKNTNPEDYKKMIDESLEKAELKLKEEEKKE